MKVFMQKSKKYWDDIFLAKDNAASTGLTEEDIHQDVSNVEVPAHFSHDLPLRSKLAFCKHDQECIPTAEMKMIVKDPELTKFVDEPARPSALKDSQVLVAMEDCDEPRKTTAYGNWGVCVGQYQELCEKSIAINHVDYQEDEWRRSR